MLNNRVMNKALVEKDPSYKGLFVVAVKTTGIFCVLATQGESLKKKTQLTAYRDNLWGKTWLPEHEQQNKQLKIKYGTAV